jgi:signal transduction histidine kinase
MAMVGLLVLLNNTKSTTNRLFALMTAALVIWPMFNYLSLHTSHHLTFVRIVMAVATIIMGSFYFLACTFPAEKFQFTRGHKIAAGYLFITSLFSLSPWLFTAVDVNGENVVPKAGPAMVLFMGLLLYFVPAGFWYLYRKEKREKSARTRLQMSYLLYGSLFMFGSILILNFALPVALHNSQLVPYGPLLNLVFLAVIAYSMVYHSLFDIRLFVVRATAYVFTQVVVSLFFLVPSTWLIIHVVGINLTGWQFTAMVGMGLMVVGLYHNLWRFFDHLTSRIFFRNYYEPQEVLDSLSNLLVKSVDVAGLQRGSKDVLKSALRIDGLEYWLRHDADTKMLSIFAELFRGTKEVLIIPDDNQIDQELLNLFKERRIAAVVQLRTTRDELGYLTLGFKQSGQLYNAQDKRLINIAADEIAIALQNALHFEEIQAFNQTLQQRVDDATRKLRASNEKLKKLDETKDEFVSMASHQLRTPLTSVKGYLSMVLEGDGGELNDTQRQMLTQSFTSAQRMVYLISDLLNLSRLNTGKFVINAGPVDLRDVVAAEFEQLSETAKVRDIQLTYQPPETFPTLMLDETKVHQVVMNFVDNSIYYTPAGGKIVLSLHETATAVEFHVQDSGIGVPREVQRHLFTKFYRADNARRMRPDGTGLGLFMAKKVIVAQGGAVLFESEEDKGSTFGFRFAKASHMVTPEQAKETSPKT